jgi:hypothetical protein
MCVNCFTHVFNDFVLLKLQRQFSAGFPLSEKARPFTPFREHGISTVATQSPIRRGPLNLVDQVQDRRDSQLRIVDCGCGILNLRVRIDGWGFEFRNPN